MLFLSAQVSNCYGAVNQTLFRAQRIKTRHLHPQIERGCDGLVRSIQNNIREHPPDPSLLFILGLVSPPIVTPGPGVQFLWQLFWSITLPQPEETCAFNHQS